MKTLTRIAVLCLLLLSCCAQIHPSVAKRRQLAGRLRSCLSEYSYNQIYRQQCVKESVMYCQEAHLESSCAYDELITDLPKDRP